jgi:PKD repeat protein
VNVGSSPTAFGQFIISAPAVEEVTQLEQINTALHKGPVLLELRAEWCEYCQQLKPILQELATEYNGKATIMSIDIDKSPTLAAYFGVSIIPDSCVIVGTDNGKYVYMQENGITSKDRSQARIVGLNDKPVYEKVLDLALFYGKILPFANFTINVTEGYAPLTVQFTNLSTNATSLYWDFGDSNNSTDPNPVHTYFKAGNYTVNLTVSNTNGTSSKLAIINVTSKPVLPIFPDSTKSPTDPNNDGLYEDINGNIRIDFKDVVAYYNNMDWIGQSGLIAYFDYNRNGRIDFKDVVKLYNMI